MEPVGSLGIEYGHGALVGASLERSRILGGYCVIMAIGRQVAEGAGGVLSQVFPAFFECNSVILWLRSDV